MSVGTSNGFDVAIIGTGIAGTVLGAILARQGVRVLLLEQGTHPRFAIGESSTPESSMVLKILAARYDVPELLPLTSFLRLQKTVATTCGMKRQFGFLYHRAGQKHNLEEATQSVISDLPDGPEMHLYRQDVDVYLLHVALRYGAVVRQNTAIVDVEINDREVRLASARGECFTARYLVDGGGFRSPLAQKFNLRETPTRLRTHSRSNFTHMLDVLPYDECVQPRGGHGMAIPWHQGTLHHVFDGGWLWVIPFNNHPGATNPLCSIGLNLDTRRFPPGVASPEAEFAELLECFPDIAPQFAKAKVVRDWVATGRLQYSSRQTYGQRYCLLAHAADFVDPLLSRGLYSSFEVINALAWRLIDACRDDDFSLSRFAYMESLQQNLLDVNDQLVSCSYTAFSDFALWNAWNRVWLLGTLLGTLRAFRVYYKFQEQHDYGLFAETEMPTEAGTLTPHIPDFTKLFEEAVGTMEAVAAGRLGSHEAVSSIMRALKDCPYAPPLLHLGDETRRNLFALNLYQLPRLTRWFRRSAPAALNQLVDYRMARALSPNRDLIMTKYVRRAFG